MQRDIKKAIGQAYETAQAGWSVHTPIRQLASLMRDPDTPDHEVDALERAVIGLQTFNEDPAGEAWRRENERRLMQHDCYTLKGRKWAEYLIRAPLVSALFYTKPGGDPLAETRRVFHPRFLSEDIGADDFYLLKSAETEVALEAAE